MPIVTFGISALFHDSACSAVVDGRVVAAAQEERFTRHKHDPRMPAKAFRFCLEQAGVAVTDIDALGYHENPESKLARQLWMGLPNLPAYTDEFFLRLDAGRPLREIRELLGFEGSVDFFPHQYSHAASAYHLSGFAEAAVLTADGVGEWQSCAYYSGSHGQLTELAAIEFPHSLGLLYSAITSFLGFRVNDGESKVMGLAAYGRPVHVDKLWNMVSKPVNGRFELDLSYFSFMSGAGMYSNKLAELFGRAPRIPNSEITQDDADIASSLQLVTEEILLSMVRHLHDITGSENLCMAGGVALNCVANGRIRREGPFRNLFVQPAANDAGCAVGAALSSYALRSRERIGSFERQKNVYLGPSYDGRYVVSLLQSSGIGFVNFSGREEELLTAVAERLQQAKVVGWYQGRMEFGPRALGTRSILADPRVESIRERVNSVVKRREAFRPFAPSAMEEYAAEIFDVNTSSPFMLETCRVRPGWYLPAVTHTDGSARLHTVNEQEGGRFYRLLKKFHSLTGCPLVLNTSFNQADEPIVCSPEDALLCFIRSGLDALILEDCLIDREKLPGEWISWFGYGGSGVESVVSDAVYAML